MRIVRLLSWFLIGGALSLVLVDSARAEYLPSQEQLDKISQLFENHTISTPGGGAVIQVGKFYEPGLAAYFGVTASNDPTWMLEEWIVLPPAYEEGVGEIRRFHYKQWKFRKDRVSFSEYIFTGSIIEETLAELKELDIASPEVVTKSEQAIELLLTGVLAPPFVIPH